MYKLILFFVGSGLLIWMVIGLSMSSCYTDYCKSCRSNYKQRSKCQTDIESDSYLNYGTENILIQKPGSGGISFGFKP